MTVQDRKPYRLIRGQYSRRDGFAIQAKDNETGAPLKGQKVQPYVRYQARTPDNPTARDELMLTDREAQALRGRVVPLIRNEDGVLIDKATLDPSRAIEPRTLEELINVGVSVNGTKTLKEFRDMVFKSGVVLGQPIPHKKAEILAMLRNIQQTAAAEAQKLGLDPLTGSGT